MKPVFFAQVRIVIRLSTVATRINEVAYGNPGSLKYKIKKRYEYYSRLSGLGKFILFEVSVTKSPSQIHCCLSYYGFVFTSFCFTFFQL